MSKFEEPFIVSKGTLSQEYRPLTADEEREIKDTAPESEGRSTLEQAVEIMGTDFFGPDSVEKALGVRLEKRDIPPIPFSAGELEHAKELGQQLRLRISKAPDGSPLTMFKLNEVAKEPFQERGLGKVLFGEAGWKKDEPFFTTDTAEQRWALVGKEIIPNSTNKNYLEQTELLVNYLQDEVFRGTVPPDYAKAIREFISVKEAIRILMTSDIKKAAEALSKLTINQLCRQKPIEALQDIVTHDVNSKDRLLENNHTWTSRLTSDGFLVAVGDADVRGAYVGRYEPDVSADDLGVVFSRSL